VADGKVTERDEARTRLSAATSDLLPPPYVGTSVPRKEDRRLIAGKGRYTGDLKFPGMLYAAAVRSFHAHARITRIDATAALELDGVVTFVSARDMQGKVRDFPEPALRDLNPNLPAMIGLEIESQPMEPLPADRVLWVGQPLGYVVAADPLLAEDAAELVDVECEPLPAVTTMDEAIAAGAPVLHPHLGTNVQQTYSVEAGDVAGALARAPRTLKAHLEIGRQVASAMETRGMMAVYDPGRAELRVWSTNIRPHLLRETLSEMLDMPADSIRCMGPDIGGSFGSGMFHEEVAIPFLARELERPVRWVEDRRENLQNTRHCRDQSHDVEVAFDDDGVISAIRDSFRVDFGAHNNYAVTVSYNVAAHFRGPFKIDDFAIRCTGVLTNKAPAAPVRGAGRPEAAFVMDRIVDLVADAVGADPLEVRRRNLISPEDMPYEMGIPYRDTKAVVYESGDFPSQLEAALELIDLASWRKRQDEQRGEVHRVGIGVSSLMEASGVGPHEGAIVRVDDTGAVSISTGAQPHGQGLETTLAQIVADQLRVNVEDVTVRPTDTAAIPYGVGTFASRSAVTAGSAVALAGGELREKVVAVAAEMLEADPADMEIVGGRVHVRGVEASSVSFADVARAARPGPACRVPPGMAPGLEVQRYFVPPTVTWASGTQVAVVEVDTETGFFTILDYASVDDCGQMLNPMIVKGQIHGGIVHGIGNAMLEEAVYGPEGQLQTSTYVDYLLPTAADVPDIKVAHQSHTTDLNPLGVKGVGEGGAVAPLAAIANAIVDALRPLRIEINRVPIHPEHVLTAIREGVRYP
jgi:aerobic carbon-monoxide dehydrogenase large subunit